MTLYTLTASVLYDATHSGLDLLTTKKESLETQYNSFLLSVQIELSPSTYNDYRYKLKYFIDFCRMSGAETIFDITTDLARAYIASIQKNHKPSTVSDYYKIARCFLGWLVREERLKNNPMEKIKSPRIPEVIIKPFTAEHIHVIMTLCEDGRNISIRNKAIILVFLDTGLRLAELTRILVNDIDIKRGIIKVMGKGAKERVVGISKTTIRAVIKYFEARTANHPQLWLTEEGKPITINGVSQIFKMLKRRAGFNDVRLSAHTFRHTAGTMELMNGASEREVQLLLGHSTTKMTRHYTASITSLNVVGRHKEFSPVDRLNLK